jgi:hypothetical protein
MASVAIAVSRIELICIVNDRPCKLFSTEYIYMYVYIFVDLYDICSTCKRLINMKRTGHKKSLKIPEGLSESLNRRTDITMATKKNGQMDKQRSRKHHTENERSGNTSPTKNGKVGSSCSTSCTRRITLGTNPVINHE